ncbi:methyl-accepting chemotaxis protein [Novosphingobium aquae]|uniref:methyl-accepting chemotaxis protein n=1 Tax=Novosphingobium aquae TaxID=3133435 RepID=UPI003A946490
MRSNGAGPRICAWFGPISNQTRTKANSIETTLRTISALSESVGSGANKANEASQAPIHSRQQAEAGYAVVRQAMEAMASIEKSSSAIAQLLTLIDGIAFQTNLLALKCQDGSGAGRRCRHGFCRGGQRSARAVTALGGSRDAN